MSGLYDERGFESKVVADEDDRGGALGARAARASACGARARASGAPSRGLCARRAKLPVDVARAALEVGAGMAALSLRAGVDFLRAVPDAARVLDAEELRAWGEMGRRLTMADVGDGRGLHRVGRRRGWRRCRAARGFCCCRSARGSCRSRPRLRSRRYRQAPEVARAVGDAELLRAVFEVALEVARRCARHSADFLAGTPAAAVSLSAFDAKEDEGGAVEMSKRAGACGTRRSRWPSLRGARRAASRPTCGRRCRRRVEGLSADEALRLLPSGRRFSRPRRRGRAARARRRAARCCGSCPRRSTTGSRCCAPWPSTATRASSRSRARRPPFFRARSPSTAPTARASRSWRGASSTRRARSRAWTPRRPSPASAPRRARLRTATSNSSSVGRAKVCCWRTLSARARRSYFALETRRSNEQLQSGGATASRSKTWRRPCGSTSRG